MTELPTSFATAAPHRVVARSHASSRRSPGRRRGPPQVPVPAASITASLTGLSRMVAHGHSILDRGGVARDLDQRLTGVIAELESLIGDLLQDSSPVLGGPGMPPTRIATSGAAGDTDPTRVEAAFEAWLIGDDKPDVWQIDAPDGPRTSLTGMFGELILSRRQLTAAAAAELGMPSGTTQGHAATELLFAVNDAAGPRCRSYRSALYYLRDHDDTFVSQ